MNCIGLFVACLLIPLTKQQCANCPITFACTDWEDFVDGVITWSTGTDANGCATLAISCGEEPGVTPAVSSKYLYAGSYLIDEDNMPITCNADGKWLPDADSQSFTCAGGTHNDDNSADEYDHGPHYDYYRANNDDDACTDHVYHRADDNNYGANDDDDDTNDHDYCAHYVYNATNDKHYFADNYHYTADHYTDHNDDHYDGQAKHIYNGAYDNNCPTDYYNCTDDKHNKTDYNPDNSVYSTYDHHSFAYDYATTDHHCDSLLRAVVCLVDNEAMHGQLWRLFKCDQNENLHHIRHMSLQDAVTPPPSDCPECCPRGGIWSSWKEGACNDTCGGFGTTTRTRTCLTAGNSCPCTGSTSEVAPCNFKPCSYPRLSCNTGFTLKPSGGQLLCTKSGPSTTPRPPAASCCPVGGVWDLWSDWSKCSSECGSCSKMTRTRACASVAYGCPCANAAQFSSQTVACFTSPCTYPKPSCCTPYTVKSVGGQLQCA